ncbi:MAG: phage portal protein [Aquamicrobium sp.]|uniref:phage portal protein n=1 Tax=Aquamicrobium sp. TaxID=1872579 RepID=UPI00349EB549|nr:phage portal protein [Aquamicrobium sp.]
MFGWLKSIVPGRNNIETRASASGFTAEIMAAREAYISGASGVGELTAAVQSCVSLWEGAFALGDVSGTDMIDRRTMAMIARSLALRGEYVALIGDRRLIPAADWDLSTRDGEPKAYRLSISEAGGGRTMTALAAEVVHFRVGADPVQPWTGQAPLRRARLTAGLLQAIESALAEVYDNAPLGSLIVPFPESPEVDMETLGRGFRRRRGRVLMRESVSVVAAGGPAPNTDWKPSDVTPNIQPAMPMEAWQAARGSILSAFGVLPALLSDQAQGPLVREAQRHLAQWTLQPLAMLIGEEAGRKLGSEIMIDLMRPVQAFDVGGRARALSTIIEALARAKEAGLEPAALNGALTTVNWGPNDGAA